MKKLLSLLSIAMLAMFVSCSKEERANVAEVTEIKFNIDVNSASTTKAVKSAFTEGDVVYIFLEGVTGNKYLTVTKNSAGNWDTELGGDITASEVSSLTTGNMYGIYFPFDNVAITSDGADGVNFRTSGHANPALNDLPIYTYYMTGTNAFTVSTEGGVATVTGGITMSIPDNYVQFFIAKSGIKYAANDQYRISVRGLKPTACASFSNGTFTETDLEAAHPVWGYLYNNEGISFTGKIDATWSTAQDHKFILFDDTAGQSADGTGVANPAKTTTFSGKTLSSHSAVRLSNVGMWDRMIPEPGTVTLGSIEWADRNLGATNVDDAGLYFAWLHIVGSTATDQIFAYSDDEELYYGGNYLTGISTFGILARTYALTDLKGPYVIFDAARAYLGSDWRTPKHNELQDLATYASGEDEWDTSYGSGNPVYVFSDGTNSIQTPVAGAIYFGSVGVSRAGNHVVSNSASRKATKQHWIFLITNKYYGAESYDIGWDDSSIWTAFVNHKDASGISVGRRSTAKTNAAPIRPVKAN